MGPVLLFDKSVLESLTIDESVWLDNFFLCNLTPLFYVETLADLEKRGRGNNSAEMFVGALAHKSPEAGSKFNAHHKSLVRQELLGAAPINMTHRRPLIPWGQVIQLGDKHGITFQESPEEDAFSRWQRGMFRDVERLYARRWRDELKAISLEVIKSEYKRFYPLGKDKSTSDVKRTVDFLLEGPDQLSVLRFGLELLSVPDEVRHVAVERWRSAGKPKIASVFPYFMHVLSVDLFFNLAVACDVIGSGRASHKIDMAYLYYLPFCNVFTSGDKLHALLAPVFLNKDQTFIAGSELKADLNKIDVHFDALPPEVKIRGVSSFATYPPLNDDFLVTRLWDKHMSTGWRSSAGKPRDPMKTIDNPKLLAELNRWRNVARPVEPDRTIDDNFLDCMIIERKVHVKKGKWMRIPPEAIQ